MPGRLDKDTVAFKQGMITRSFIVVGANGDITAYIDVNRKFPMPWLCQ